MTKERQRRRRRWLAQPQRWRQVSEAADPLRRTSRWAILPWIVGLAAAHLLLLSGTGHATRRQRPRSAPLEVSMTVRAPESKEAPEPVEPNVPLPENVVPPKVVPSKVVSEAKRAKAAPRAMAPQSAAPKRIVGLSLSSTVKGGGAAFAVGNTRAGVTGRVADAPDAPKRADAEPRLDVRVATRRDRAVERPRRLRRLEPEYPEAYRRRGLEGRVVVELVVGIDGLPNDVRLIATSEHAAFNDAARRAAHRERFRPATKDGAAVPFRLRFTYHFRRAS